MDDLSRTAHDTVHATHVANPMRAFVYLTTGHPAADRHFEVFARWHEEKRMRTLGMDAAALKASRTP